MITVFVTNIIFFFMREKDINLIKYFIILEKSKSHILIQLKM